MEGSTEVQSPAAEAGTEPQGEFSPPPRRSVFSRLHSEANARAERKKQQLEEKLKIEQDELLRQSLHVKVKPSTESSHLTERLYGEAFERRERRQQLAGASEVAPKRNGSEARCKRQPGTPARAKTPVQSSCLSKSSSAPRGLSGRIHKDGDAGIEGHTGSTSAAASGAAAPAMVVADLAASTPAPSVKAPRAQPAPAEGSDQVVPQVDSLQRQIDDLRLALASKDAAINDLREIVQVQRSELGKLRSQHKEAASIKQVEEMAEVIRKQQDQLDAHARQMSEVQLSMKNMDRLWSSKIVKMQADVARVHGAESDGNTAAAEAAAQSAPSRPRARTSTASAEPGRARGSVAQQRSASSRASVGGADVQKGSSKTAPAPKAAGRAKAEPAASQLSPRAEAADGQRARSPRGSLTRPATGPSAVAAAGDGAAGAAPVSGDGGAGAAPTAVEQPSQVLALPDGGPGPENAGVSLPAEQQSFFTDTVGKAPTVADLADGDVLCELMNALVAGSIVPDSNSAVKIAQFLGACADLGVGPDEAFVVADLYPTPPRTEEDLAPVVRCLQALQRATGESF